MHGCDRHTRHSPPPPPYPCIFAHHTLYWWPSMDARSAYYERPLPMTPAAPPTPPVMQSVYAMSMWQRPRQMLSTCYGCSVVYAAYETQDNVLLCDRCRRLAYTTSFPELPRKKTDVAAKVTAHERADGSTSWASVARASKSPACDVPCLDAEEETGVSTDASWDHVPLFLR
jgi:hypothetical protein